MSEKKEKAPRHDDCIYNDGVCCEKHEKCGKCGWNPRIAELRMIWRRVRERELSE